MFFRGLLLLTLLKSCAAEECIQQESLASIPKTSLTASSNYKDDTGLNLNSTESRIDSTVGWSALTKTEDKPWIQADLGSCRSIKKVVTQGRRDVIQWTTKYSLGFSNDGEKWTSYEEPAGTVKVFDGNTGSATNEEKVTNTLAIAATARFVRLYVEAFSDWPSLRWDVISCDGAVDFPALPECPHPYGTSGPGAMPCGWKLAPLDVLTNPETSAGAKACMEYWGVDPRLQVDGGTVWGSYYKYKTDTDNGDGMAMLLVRDAAK